MVSIAMMIGGAVINALAFTGSNFVFAREQLTKARDEWSKERLKYLDYLNDRLRKEADAKKSCIDINEAMNEYYVVTGNRFALPQNLREEPKLEDL